jgi:DNA helicase-2/ATP-dependent DNA helicase PcrA
VIEEFLAHAALEAGDGQSESRDSAVQMMTLHSAKGLEFPLVFISGMDEGVFPHRMSDAEPVRLEEERRLCYVGITRAMKQLYLCHAEVRRLNGIEQRTMPSRFVREIPREFVSEVRLRGAVVRPTAGLGLRASSSSMQDPSSPLRIGQRVRHGSFGEGVVLGCDGTGERAHVHIKFEHVGEKRLILGMARLEAVD